MQIDLHMHTNFSACANKSNSWQELLKKAETEKIDVLSITDHNTCAFYLEDAEKVKELFSGKIISGVELDVFENGVAFELLAYDFDVKQVDKYLNKTYGTLQTRQNKLKDKLINKAKENNIKVDLDIRVGELEYAHKCVYENMKTFRENSQFFEKYSINSFSDLYRLSTEDKKFPLYIDVGEIFPGVNEVVSQIHKHKGIVVLAHPYNYKTNVNVEMLLQIALESGMDGIEVFHPSASISQIKSLLKFATKNNLLVTGGSDYHGTAMQNKIGLNAKQSKKIVDRFDSVLR